MFMRQEPRAEQMRTKIDFGQGRKLMLVKDITTSNTYDTA